MNCLSLKFDIIILLLLKCTLSSPEDLLNHTGKCKGIWRPDNLIGRCFGLTMTKDIKDIEGVNTLNITSASLCRSLCCNLDEKCVSWQYEKVESICKIGGPVRLGLEVTGTPEWCDPYPDMKWNGRTLKSRTNTCECKWDMYVTKQCYGLGAERLNSTKQRLDTFSCQQACCNDPTCGIWQELPNRGCYYAPFKDASCSKDPDKKYSGGRKCIPNFCGGLEDKILNKNSIFPPN